MLSWPPYAQPTAAARPGPALPMATALVDLFYLQRHLAATRERVAVCACLGGTLLVTLEPQFGALPAPLQQAITRAEVTQRGQFRTLVARELFIGTFAAMEQLAATEGLNDSVTVFCQAQALIQMDGQPTVEATNQDGHCTIGRLDLLWAYSQSLAARFAMPGSEPAWAYHLLVPLAPAPQISQGGGLGLLYPVLDPAHFHNLDTGTILLRIGYELLLHLQHDLAAVQPDHPFAVQALPVPSRQRLEAELVADGYQVQGDLAFRSDATARHKRQPKRSALIRQSGCAICRPSRPRLRLRPGNHPLPSRHGPMILAHPRQNQRRPPMRIGRTISPNSIRRIFHVAQNSP
jgi:hypothetical protein